MGFLKLTDTHLLQCACRSICNVGNKCISGEPIGCRAHITWIIRANHRADLQFFLDPVDVVRLQSAKYQSWSETGESVSHFSRADGQSQPRLFFLITNSDGALCLIFTLSTKRQIIAYDAIAPLHAMPCVYAENKAHVCNKAPFTVSQGRASKWAPSNAGAIFGESKKATAALLPAPATLLFTESSAEWISKLTLFIDRSKRQGIPVISRGDSVLFCSKTGFLNPPLMRLPTKTFLNTHPGCLHNTITLTWSPSVSNRRLTLL